MSNPRIFQIYYQLKDSEDFVEDPVNIQIFEHDWRFLEVFQMVVMTSIPEVELGEQRMKYSDEEGEIHKIRGGEDFGKFVEMLERVEETHENVVILESTRRKSEILNDGEIQIHPSALQVGEFVGDGTHGTVRKAYHQPTDKWYVIKTTVSRNVSRENIEKEILAYKECSKSEFVIGYFGCEVSTSKKELVLEYMDKRDLRFFGVLPVEIHQQVALAVIRGLRHIWKSGPGYIHRDIKPDNILVNSEGFIKISDFGAAKRIDNTYRIACSSAGTECYQAPEQRMGMDYDEKVDVWSYGQTLWKLAIGSAFDDLDMFDDSEKTRVPLIDGYPETLTELIRNCLRWSPELRWNADQIENCGYLKNVEIDRNIVRDFVNKN